MKEFKLEKFNELLPEEMVRPLVQVLDWFCNTLAENVVVHTPDPPDFSQVKSTLKKVLCEQETLNGQLENIRAHNDLLENANQIIQQLNDHFYDERIILPMVRGLFPIVDLIEEAHEKLHDQGMTRRQVAVKYLDAIQTQLEQFLAGYGIERFCHETEMPFDSKMMKPIKAILTTEKKLNGLMAESLQYGFKIEQRILRMETVSLYKYSENL